LFRPSKANFWDAGNALHGYIRWTLLPLTFRQVRGGLGVGVAIAPPVFILIPLIIASSFEYLMPQPHDDEDDRNNNTHNPA
jgi:hypothetical protein